VNAFSGNTHAAFGFVMAILLHILGFEVGAWGIFFLLFGSLLPDIDHKRSILGRYNVLNWFGLFKHRGKCHTLIGSFLLSVPFYVLGGMKGLIFTFVGAVGHLCADKLYSYGKKKKPFAIRIW
jgi:membrane-bound metal-dependent hydrolase YbcI (DUF457 family)